MSEEVKIKRTVPMFEVGELERFDNNIHSIVEEYSKLMIKEKDQILTQRLIMKQEEEIQRLKRQIKIKDKWCDRIWEIGTDYDGYGNNLEELKKLVDELIEYSIKAKKCDDKSVAYISYENGKKIKENILMEELGSDEE